MMNKRKYNSYKYGNRLESFFDVPQDTVPKMDRYYMYQQMYPIINFLREKGLTEFEDFAHLFKRYKMKNNDILCFIKSLVEYINSRTQEKKISWIRERELKKANFCEKNIIITRIIVEYYDSFLSFFSNYIIQNYFSIHNIKTFITEFESKAKDLIEKVDSNSNEKIEINDISPVSNLHEISLAPDIEIVSIADLYKISNLII